jgi:hypothetical protein
LVTATLRFRPVLFGAPAQLATAVLFESEDGRVFFLDVEYSSSIDLNLESVTPQHLPPPYCRADVEIRILPVQEAGGATRSEAFDRMLDALGARQRPERRRPARARRAS